MEGLELLARFAYQPNKLGICKPECSEKLYNYIMHKTNSDEIKNILFSLPNIKFNLELISKITGKSKEDYSIIEAYCLGNELIDKFSKVPHHSYYVLINGSKLMVERMNKCLVTWGEVRKIEDNNLIVNYQPLKYEDKFFLGSKIEQKVLYNKQILPSLEIGDYVAMHWNFAFKKLEQKEIENLNKYTLRSIDIINSNSI